MWLAAIIYGFLLGLGAAIPIGPMNLEIIRRNLRFGTRCGIAFASGVSSVDFTYVLLLSLGALPFLQYPTVLTVISVFGALVLAWFGIGALRLKAVNTPNQTEKMLDLRLGKQWLQGYLMTLVSPFTVLFWASVSSQIAVQSLHFHYAWAFTSTGAALGAFTWAFAFNGVLHYTRHKLSPRTIQVLNKIGGVILLLFAGLGLIKAFV